jgi:outer membrane protein TolC
MGVITLCIVAVGSMVFAIGDDQKPGADESRINELLKERLAVLDEVAKLNRAAYERGEASTEAVLASESDVLLAKLELSTTQDERIAIREDLVASAKQLEELTIRMMEAGQGTQIDRLKAKALRLRAESDLIRERLGKAK